jgi:hypothetical protein
MKSEAEISYNNILRLIRQLPKREIKKLSIALQSEISTDKASTSLQKIILQAPTWDESDFDALNNARLHIDKSRIA